MHPKVPGSRNAKTTSRSKRRNATKKRSADESANARDRACNSPPRICIQPQPASCHTPHTQCPPCCPLFPCFMLLVRTRTCKPTLFDHFCPPPPFFFPRVFEFDLDATRYNGLNACHQQPPTRDVDHPTHNIYNLCLFLFFPFLFLLLQPTPCIRTTLRTLAYKSHVLLLDLHPPIKSVLNDGQENAYDDMNR